MKKKMYREIYHKPAEVKAELQPDKMAGEVKIKAVKQKKAKKGDK